MRLLLECTLYPLIHTLHAKRSRPLKKSCATRYACLRHHLRLSSCWVFTLSNLHLSQLSRMVAWVVLNITPHIRFRSLKLDSQSINSSSQLLCPSAMTLSLLGFPAVSSLGSPVVGSTASYHPLRSHLQSYSFNNCSHLSWPSPGFSMPSLGSLVLSSLGSSLLSPFADSQPKVDTTTICGNSAWQSARPYLDNGGMAQYFVEYVFVT